MNERIYQVRPAIFVPVILFCLSIWVSAKISWWFFISVPFIYLGSICAQPNLNLANGCLAYVSMIIGTVISPFHLFSGAAIGLGAGISFYGSAIEKRLRMKPIADHTSPQ